MSSSAYVGLCPECRRPYPLARGICPRDGAALEAPAATPLTRDDLVDERFVVLETLGDGGMARVLRVYDKRTRSMRALKVLHPELARRAGFIERFFEEARALSRLQHPHLVSMHGCGQTPNGHLYLVLDYVQGEPLSVFARGACRLPLRDLLDLASQALAGLAAAHRAGVVHRDFKAENIMVAREPHRPSVATVVDFGLACVYGEVRTTKPRLAGTPSAMSPEAIRGEEVGPPADCYSAGCMLFELLTGRHPFPYEHPAAMMNAQVHEEAPDVESLVAGLHLQGPLAGVVQACLAKDPKERPGAVTELREAVEEARDGLPNLNDPISELHSGPTLVLRGSDSENTLEDWHLGDTPTLVDGWDVCETCERLLEAGGDCPYCEPASLPESPEDRRAGEGKGPNPVGTRGAALAVLRFDAGNERRMHEVRERFGPVVEAFKEKVSEHGFVLQDRGDELRALWVASDGDDAATDPAWTAQIAAMALRGEIHGLVRAARRCLAQRVSVTVSAAVAAGPVVWAGLDRLEPEQVLRGAPPDLARRLIRYAGPWEVVVPDWLANPRAPAAQLRLRTREEPAGAWFVHEGGVRPRRGAPIPLKPPKPAPAPPRPQVEAAAA